MAALIAVEKKERYAILTLNRAEAMNALSRGLREEFVAAVSELSNDKQMDVVIITGAGKAFCAGFDLKELSLSESNAAESAENSMAQVMASFGGPIIAAVNGHAITGGFELALACDFIIASDKASFADTHARVGILPGWGLSQRLPRLIGLARAKEISFTGNAIGAETAYEWGLVNRVVEPDQLMPICEKLAEDIASCIQPIVKQYKKLIDDGYSMPQDKALSYEASIGLESAKAASAAMISSRKEKVFKRGRNQD